MYTNQSNKPDYALANLLAVVMAASMSQGLDLEEVALRLLELLDQLDTEARMDANPSIASHAVRRYLVLPN